MSATFNFFFLFIDEADKEKDDNNELAARPSVFQPAIRPWERPPTQKPDAGRRKYTEPSPGASTRLPRHTRRGSDLESACKRSKPVHPVTSSPDPLEWSYDRFKQSASPAFFPGTFFELSG